MKNRSDPDGAAKKFLKGAGRATHPTGTSITGDPQPSDFNEKTAAFVKSLLKKRAQDTQATQRDDKSQCGRKKRARSVCACCAGCAGCAVLRRLRRFAPLRTVCAASHRFAPRLISFLYLELPCQSTVPLSTLRTSLYIAVVAVSSCR